MLTSRVIRVLALDSFRENRGSVEMMEIMLTGDTTQQCSTHEQAASLLVNALNISECSSSN